MSDIKPAVSAELWKQVAAAGGPANLDAWVGETPEACAHIIAMNNAAFPDGDPRKFTWVDVAMLRGIASFLPYEWKSKESQLRLLVERIEALLPPREKAG